jgi:phosphoglycolate phosphatase
MNSGADGNIRAVIFDLDGTLLYTLADITRTINTVLRRHGYPEHREEEYRGIVGYGLRESLRNALPQGVSDEGLVDRLVDELVAEYDRTPVRETVPYAGIPELLDHLHKRNVPAAVLTNKRQSIAREVVRQVLAERTFSVVLGDGGAFPRKPDPASALHIAAELGIGAEETLLLGDSAVDVETARAAGMIAGGALWGYKPAELQAAGADYLFSAPQGVAKLFP